MQSEDAKPVVWTPMDRQSIAQSIVWNIDKRLFRWDHLPSLARLKVIQRSYLLLLILPALDKLMSPIFLLPDGIRVALDISWIKVLPEGTRVAFELGIPFSWNCIYFLVLFVGLASLTFEIFCPALVRGQLPHQDQPTRQLILQEVRKLCLQLFTARRMNHVFGTFLEAYTTNSEDLRTPSPKYPDILPLQDKNSKVRLSKESVYHIAERMNLRDDALPDALETIRWFANESRALARWACGSFLLVAVSLFAWLVLQGLVQIVS